MSDMLVTSKPATDEIAADASAESNAPQPSQTDHSASEAPTVRGLRGGRSLLGMDIGRRTLKLVHLQHTGAGLRIHGAAEVALPPTSNPERAGVVNQAVRDFIRSARPKIRHACCALSGEGVATLCCSMPKMSQGELHEATRWKTAEVSSVNAETSVHGFYVLDPDAPGSKHDIVTAAVPHDVRQVDTLFPNDNPRLSTLVTGPIATEDVLVTALRAKNPGSVGVLDIGTGSATLSVIGPNGLEFTRELPVGGDNVTAALTGKLPLQSGAVEISRQAAEAVKRHYQIGQSDDVSVADVVVPSARVLSAIRPVLERLSSEIVRSLQFYAQSHGLKKVRTLYLCGGGSQLAGLPEYLAHEARLTVEVLDPWKLLGADVAPDVQVNRSLFTPATGAALHNPSRINLLPAHVRTRHTVSLIRAGSLVFSSVLLLALIGFTVTTARQNAKLGAVLEAKEKSTAPMERLAALVDESHQIKAELDRRVAIQQSLGVGRPMYAAILRELSQIMPEGTYLKNLSFSMDQGVRKAQLEVDIYAMPNASSVRLKQGLITALEDSPFFVNVSFAPRREREKTDDRRPDEALTLTSQVLGFPGD